MGVPEAVQPGRARRFGNLVEFATGRAFTRRSPAVTASAGHQIRALPGSANARCWSPKANT